MKIRELGIAGGWEITPQQHGDPRGLFMEWLRTDRLAAELGRAPEFMQGNMSVSARGVVRGIHFTDVPPGQAKYVTCVRGAVLDVVVDVREGSPTFGGWDAVRLDDTDRRAVFLAEGLGHGFCALSDDATLMYLCSTTYQPDRDRGIHPLDADLGIEWPIGDPQLSAKDAAAPSLSALRADGMLPQWSVCREYLTSRGPNGDFSG